MMEEERKVLKDIIYKLANNHSLTEEETKQVEKIINEVRYNSEYI